MVGVAEQDQDFDVGEPKVGKPFVDVVDPARGSGGFTAGVFAAQVADPHGVVLEAEVQVAFHMIE